MCGSEATDSASPLLEIQLATLFVLLDSESSLLCSDTSDDVFFACARILDKISLISTEGCSHCSWYKGALGLILNIALYFCIPWNVTADPPTINISFAHGGGSNAPRMSS